MSKSPKAWLAELAEPLPVSCRPMKGGLGRELRFRAAIESVPQHERRELLEALSEVTRPMTARELDEALLRSGLPRADRRRLVNALKGLAIVMIGSERA
jgi:hypothetical protein